MSSSASLLNVVTFRGSKREARLISMNVINLSLVVCCIDGIVPRANAFFYSPKRAVNLLLKWRSEFTLYRKITMFLLFN